ncbi:acety-l/propionyl-CoA carboxylase subunit alpha [Streptomyces sp. HNM0575]|uniref:acetyl/propionyl/methylcrotonyl-CoA carboxylase subunit alpha n=1 Tax=Streptomyces sp. HNM0575 TaxID=2716338 RepID=UPI00145CA5A4|nr:biotin carboxylase N-terminal domain-containing protein [Streptomyces sp. HNM0575]NLU74238.1 acety-l/propionyl-CoA carboxylase subunit alpha [Streptomyces sp. HNM0575]
MITSVLVANRGEIARRVFRTCAELGVATVAVHSDADARAPHVLEADAAVRLPGDSPADTYLRGDLIVEAALAAGADAVHPGYGFLSENAGFARAVLDAGLVWIGPPPAAIEAMASKTRAKELMREAGVPLLDPVRPEDATGGDLPLLVKAAAGGGGRGMRIVRELAALEGEIEAARAEAAAAFGDGEVFVEPYVERGRHVEVQILADAHGTVWTLGTRDCSLQRRHQKVVEEAPAPGLSPGLLDVLHESAADAARAVDYRGAGTVEFLVAGGGTGDSHGTGDGSGTGDGHGTGEGEGEGEGEPRAYFLEMNTRLQVEHPVTECVHGVDLVALQLGVAEGEPLDPDGPPAARGHAVEARLYAEDPARGWQPQTGILHRLEVPGAWQAWSAATAAGAPAGVRLDSGVSDGDVIGVHYDPMLAKVVAWAPTRREAVRRLASALERASVHGPVTNRDLLVRSLRHPDFAAGRLDTGFYDRNLEALTATGPESGGESGPEPGGEQNRRLAALAAALADAARTRATGGSVSARLGGWRNVPAHPQSKTYRAEPSGDEIEVRYRLTRDGLRLEGGDLGGLGEAGGPSVRLLEAAPGRVALEVDGVRRDFAVARYGDGGNYADGDGGSHVHVDAPPPLGSYAFTALPRLREPETVNDPGSLLAPMPGAVARVVPGLAVGSAVKAGEPLLWLEAMKMEHKVVAPASGTLTALHAEPGRQVEVGELLAVVSENGTTQPAQSTETARTAQPAQTSGAAAAEPAPASAP